MTIPRVKAFVCKRHGLRANSETKCTLCDPICEGCGGYIDPHVTAGEHFIEENPHKDCDKKTEGFFITHNPDIE